MAEVSIDLNMVRVTNEDFVKKAEACTPELLKTVVRPVSIVDIVKTEEVYPEVHKKDEIKIFQIIILQRETRFVWILEIIR